MPSSMICSMLTCINRKKQDANQRLHENPLSKHRNRVSTFNIRAVAQLKWRSVILNVETRPHCPILPEDWPEGAEP